MMRVRVSVLIVMSLLLVGGFAGYFIPFNNYTLDVVEQNQKKNLTEQNKKLLQRIHSMRQMLHSLGTRVNSLDHKKKELEGYFALPATTDSAELAKKKQREPDLTYTLNLLSNTERFLGALAMKVDSSDYYFQDVPLVKPVTDNYVITNTFGEMKDPFSGTMKKHYGVDFAAERGRPVIATAAGKVTSVQNHKFWGKRIEITHSHGFLTVYAHLGSVEVHRGKRVKRGDVIGTIGSTGLTTGPQLHYEIRKYDKPVDPQKYFFPEQPLIFARADSL
ncbi:MAG: M23 family metallopeptidase [Fibrobacterota bacterium]